MGELINKLNQVLQIKEELRTTLGLSPTVPFSDYKHYSNPSSTVWSQELWQSVYNESLALSRGDWKDFPAFTPGEEKIYILVNVINNIVNGTPTSNNNVITLNSISGNYTVDWGDGSATENYNAGAVNASHTYSFTDVDLGTHLTVEGYKQAIITITPQTPTGLTTFLSAGTIAKYAIKVAINAPYMTSCSFNNWYGLKEVSLGENIITDFTQMFYGCFSLTTIPLIVTSSGTIFTNMFSSCYSLTTIPLIDTSIGSDFTNMFYGCSSLTTIPLIVTSSGTIFTNMFQNCSILTTIPLIDTSGGTDFTNMFSGCSILTTIPLIDTSIGDNFSYMFSSCYSLTTIPLIDTSSGTNFSYMFNNCYSLTTIPLINTSSGTNFSYMFQNCRSLTDFPALDFRAAFTTTSMFQNCYSLSKIQAIHDLTFSVANCNLSSIALNALYHNLVAVATPGAATITVTGNPGVTGDDTTIATAKNWAVSG